MEREELIRKWLDYDLNEAEQKAFEALEDHDQLIQLSQQIRSFKAPEYSIDDSYQVLKDTIYHNKKQSKSWLKPFIRIAAVLLIGFSIFYFTSNPDTNIETLAAEHVVIELPDASSVNLNASSSLSYNESKWDNVREVFLKGEAFFKVAKGSKFDVNTEDGIVSVLGTQFNVKQRLNYFEVTCYEGLVAVKYNNNTTTLEPGNKYVVINGEIITNEKENSIEPSWLNSESTFKSRPIKNVFNEFERQFNIAVNTKSIDTSLLFTGSFTHENMDLALKSITLPLNLTYHKTGSSIIIKSE